MWSCRAPSRATDLPFSSRARHGWPVASPATLPRRWTCQRGLLEGQPAATGPRLPGAHALPAGLAQPQTGGPSRRATGDPDGWPLPRQLAQSQWWRTRLGSCRARRRRGRGCSRWARRGTPRGWGSSAAARRRSLSPGGGGLPLRQGMRAHEQVCAFGRLPGIKRTNKITQ